MAEVLKAPGQGLKKPESHSGRGFTLFVAGTALVAALSAKALAEPINKGVPDSTAIASVRDTARVEGKRAEANTSFNNGDYGKAIEAARAAIKVCEQTASSDVVEGLVILHKMWKIIQVSAIELKKKELAVQASDSVVYYARLRLEKSNDPELRFTASYDFLNGAVAFHNVGNNDKAVETAKQGMAMIIQWAGDEQALTIFDFNMLNFFGYILHMPAKDSSYEYVDMTEDLTRAFKSLETAEQYPRLLGFFGPNAYGFAMQQLYVESNADFFAGRYEQAKFIVKKAIGLLNASLPEGIETRPVPAEYNVGLMGKVLKAQNVDFGTVRRSFLELFKSLDADIAAKQLQSNKN